MAKAKQPELNPHCVKARELCALLGCNQQQPSRWVREGAPRNSDGSFSVPDMHKWLIERAKEKVKPTGLTDERTQLVAAQRKRQIVKLHKETDEVIPVSGVVSAVSDGFRSVRDMALQIHDQVAAEFPKKYQSKLRESIRRKVIRMLDELWRAMDPWVDEKEKAKSLPRVKRSSGSRTKKSKRSTSRRSTKSAER